jgi:F0F1-type ATP synthase membrane subunit b/b'
VTNAQLYVAIGVPVLALIFAMVTNFALISRAEKRVDETRDLLRAQMNETRDLLRGQIDDLRASMQRQMDDLRAAMQHQINDTRDLLRAEIAASEARTATAIADLRLLIEKNHSEMMLKFMELDHRLSRIESERRIVG